MQVTEDQTDAQSLSALGAEAVVLLVSRDFDTLADRFGYALAHGREVAEAIEFDFAACLSESEGSADRTGRPVTVKYFQTNDAGLLAAVECIAYVAEGAAILLELVVTGTGAERHVTLEGISPVF
ncbi:hypothetical protein CH75_05905 [Dyella jiangningensis]|nr:hypothetical protein CH75_05905 [Dyella jiangningensis]